MATVDMQIKALAGLAVTIYTAIVAYGATIMQQAETTIDSLIDYGLVIVFGFLALRQVVKWLDAARANEKKQYEERIDDRDKQLALRDQRIKDLERENSELLKNR